MMTDAIPWNGLAQLAAIEQHVAIPTRADTQYILWNLTSFPLGDVTEVIGHLRMWFCSQREHIEHPWVDEYGEYREQLRLPSTPYMENVNVESDVL